MSDESLLSSVALASVIITSYNYARFLRGAIDSALSQTYPRVEVIVVDDGSTDNSREIIAGYGTRVVPVIKENGGMGSAFNAGFTASHGQVIFFLDADDTLLPTAVERAVTACLEPGVAKVHWPLWIVDDEGCRTAATYPDGPLSEGDLRDCVLRHGATGYVWPMTSGNAWARTFVERVFPMPEDEYRSAGESYLATLAPAFGSVKAVREPMGTYRLHAQSLSYQTTIRDRMTSAGRRHALLKKAFDSIGLEADADRWSPDAATRQQILLTCAELEALLPPHSRFMFVEWNQWGPGRIVSGCEAVPFPERRGQYWGKPVDDAAAIEELERQRLAGASFIVFAWPALWWLEYYSELHRYLRNRFSCVLGNERLQVFSL